MSLGRLQGLAIPEVKDRDARYTALVTTAETVGSM